MVTNDFSYSPSICEYTETKSWDNEGCFVDQWTQKFKCTSQAVINHEHYSAYNYLLMQELGVHYKSKICLRQGVDAMVCNNTISKNIKNTPLLANAA